jgi:hypothetical protein
MFRNGLVVQGRRAVTAIRRRMGLLSLAGMEEVPATGR